MIYISIRPKCKHIQHLGMCVLTHQKDNVLLTFSSAFRSMSMLEIESSVIARRDSWELCSRSLPWKPSSRVGSQSEKHTNTCTERQLFGFVAPDKRKLYYNKWKWHNLSCIYTVYWQWVPQVFQQHTAGGASIRLLRQGPHCSIHNYYADCNI